MKMGKLWILWKSQNYFCSIVQIVKNFCNRDNLLNVNELQVNKEVLKPFYSLT